MDFFAFLSFILLNHFLTDGLPGRGAVLNLGYQPFLPPLDPTYELTTLVYDIGPTKNGRIISLSSCSTM